jgi:ABC-2 type transport system ATP-binding protein
LNAIEAAKLTKVFGKEIVAVKEASFTVEEGEIFGLLGPNGAGKTTIIRMIITLTKPTSGSITVFGLDALHKASDVRKLVGYVPQLISVDGQLTAYENLLIFAKLFYVERSIRKKRIEDALEYMGLADRANDLVMHFSGGMMRRLEIAQALVNRPKILFLDEPSIGLDPTSKKQGWEYIKNLNSEFGVTVFITTHDMLEADELCDRIAIMNKGEIAALGSPTELKSKISGDLVTLTLSGPATNVLLPREFGSIVNNDQENIKIQTDHAETALPRLIEFFSKSGLKIESISISRPTLDDVFTKYTKSSLADQGEGMYREARMTRRSFARHSG